MDGESVGLLDCAGSGGLVMVERSWTGGWSGLQMLGGSSSVSGSSYMN